MSDFMQDLIDTFKRWTNPDYPIAEYVLSDGETSYPMLWVFELPKAELGQLLKLTTTTMVHACIYAGETTKGSHLVYHGGRLYVLSANPLFADSTITGI